MLFSLVQERKHSASCNLLHLRLISTQKGTRVPGRLQTDCFQNRKKYRRLMEEEGEKAPLQEPAAIIRIPVLVLSLPAVAPWLVLSHGRSFRSPLSMVYIQSE